MLLRRTRSLARLLVQNNPHEWPPLGDGVIRMVRESGDSFVSMLTHRRIKRIATAYRLHVALDEWLCSTDRESLSAKQRAICGCALLELFLKCPTMHRDSPTVLTAISNIAPAVREMPLRAIGVLRHVARELSMCRQLHASEVGLLRTFNYVCATLCRRSDEESLSSLRSHILNACRDAVGTEIDELQDLMSMVRRCPGLPSNTRSLFSWKWVHRNC